MSSVVSVVVRGRRRTERGAAAQQPRRHVSLSGSGADGERGVDAVLVKGHGARLVRLRLRLRLRVDAVLVKGYGARLVSVVV